MKYQKNISSLSQSSSLTMLITASLNFSARDIMFFLLKITTNKN